MSTMRMRSCYRIVTRGLTFADFTNQEDCLTNTNVREYRTLVHFHLRGFDVLRDAIAMAQYTHHVRLRLTE